MSIVYKIYHPLTGEHIDAYSSQECLEQLANLAMQCHMYYTNNSPYFIVETSADGTSQVWRNPQGEEVLSPEEITREVMFKQSALITTLPATPIETIP